MRQFQLHAIVTTMAKITALIAKQYKNFSEGIQIQSFITIFYDLIHAGLNNGVHTR